MAPRLKLGLIGTGVAARELYFPAWAKLGHKIELVACTNRTRRKAEAYAKLCKIPKVVDGASALIDLPEVEAVLVSLPIHLQPNVVLEALKAGKAVISEKPIAPSVSAAKTLIEKAARFEPPWLVGENFRFMPHVERLREWIHKGRLGEVRLVQANQLVTMDETNPYFHTGWRHEPKHVGAFVVDAGVHLADVVLRCIGPVKRVSAISASLSALPPPDTAVGALQFESGALGTWSSCFSASYEGPILRVIGSAGSAELYWDQAKLRDRRGRETTFTTKANSFVLQFSHFADVVRKGVMPAVTPEEALADLDLVERLAGGRSIRR